MQKSGATDGVEDHPTVSFVMSVRNGERYLREAVQSLLNQSFGDFECIIVDSASTDATPVILQELAAQDGRIRLLTVPDVKLNQSQALNLGLAAARGTWIARMDADDRSHPQRLAKQLAFLSDHPTVGLLGTACRVVDGSGTVQQKLSQPLDDLAIRWTWLCHNPFLHASVMFRRLLVDGRAVRYDEKAPFHSDYLLWGQLMQQMQVANLGACLVDQRDHGDNYSLLKHNESQEAFKQLVKSNLQRLLPDQLWSDASVQRLRGMVLYPPYLKDYRTMREAAEVLQVWRRFKEQHANVGETHLEQVEREVLVQLLAAVPMSHMLQAWRCGLLKEVWQLNAGVVRQHLKFRVRRFTQGAPQPEAQGL
ncbi:glycosyl transferase, family 2 [Magnetococcus marinus MC-1]|uniref:Glycosyl transferase, family 2 n=1 Tax=Magnetococcus marinus (strain ATCC BAA-1437 / JCM 17883 / MC-1) TaxID=156889 RepID=A0LCR4_MAGMM|nr:glycosyltransferase [Magnetococcus marinus]ABK45757.1 glycosyl transferase, family 2 [Magnetococcus marinus MC-1]